MALQHANLGVDAMTDTERAEMHKDIRRKIAYEQHGANPPPQLQTGTMAKRYGLTCAEVLAEVKRIEGDKR